ncbi:cytochrome c [Methyloceanibacter sp.]|uniref:c-type cytochrome n=1 Tax=Methyloceanibacter sp. TaxID=1965321 RepID=UPI0025EE15E7|nr:cytochrome c [Methyloceanibacter sp.]
MRKLLLLAVALVVAGGLVFYLLTMPVTISAAALPDHTPDLENGKTMFIAGGCAECHAAPVKGCDGLDVEDETRLVGGRCLKTDVGTFHVPNISPDKETGIGSWSTLDFVNAMKRGVGPGGVHLYPAFPYTSYQRMRFEDLIDLKAYLDTLPAVRSTVPAHDLKFPYNIRRGVGLFQRLYVDGKTFKPDPNASDAVNRGGYLVMGPGHCTECHSSRNALGGIVAAQAFAGARSPDGKGDAPNITPSDDGMSEWTEEDIAYFLETGSTPDFDVVGEAMVPVQENMARLPASDREAIAAFLRKLPPRPDAVKGRETP